MSADEKVSPPGSEIKIVDRRWWVRSESAEQPAEQTEGWQPGKPTYVEELERQLAEKDDLLQSYIAEHKRAVGEFEEARARIRRDVSKEVERGKRAILAELLEVLDNLDRAVGAAREFPNIDALLQGVDLVRHQFRAKLEGFGVKRIEALGRPFDPARHEAVSLVPAESAEQDGMVVGIITEGYQIGDEILRPAAVAIARVPSSLP